MLSDHSGVSRGRRSRLSTRPGCAGSTEGENVRTRGSTVLVSAAVTFMMFAPVAISTTASAAPTNNNFKKLLDAVSVEGVMRHERALQDIATASGGTRASGTTGYDASAQYVYNQLVAAGYAPVLQEFEFPFFRELAPAVLQQVAPIASSYPTSTFTFSGSGDVTAPATFVDVQIPPPATPGSTSGCEASDFAGFPTGNIAVVQRGTCNFSVKAQNAQAAGAVAVVIFNEGHRFIGVTP